MNFQSFVQKIEENQWQVHGVEVYVDHEQIWKYGETLIQRFPIYSATKTITSLAVGMAMDAGKMDISNSVLYYLPKVVTSALPNEQKELYQKLTIERLLTMSVLGFPFRPQGDSWLYHSLRYPIRPDKREFAYSNVPAYLAGVAVSNALGEDLYEFLLRELFHPLGIEEPPYQRCPDGYFYGASGMKLTVNELSRIGFVLMDRGVWQGKRIVSEAYIKNACRNQQINREGGYGYFVWNFPDGFSINGKWGQKCYIFPKRQLMITYLANMENNSDELKECMRRYLLD